MRTLVTQLEEALHTDFEEDIRVIHEEYPVSSSYWALWERRREGYVKTSGAYQKIRRKIANRFEQVGLGGQKSFKRVVDALSKAFEILGKYGIEAGEAFDARHYQYDSGNRYISLRYSNRKKPVEIEKSALSFSWHRMESGDFEIVSYLL